MLFDDATPNGMLDPYSLHAGRPVVKVQRLLVQEQSDSHQFNETIRVRNGFLHVGFVSTGAAKSCRWM